MKTVVFEFHSRRRQIFFWLCVAVVTLMFLIGPYLASFMLFKSATTAQKNTDLLHQLKSQNSTLQTTADGVQSLLNFVAQTQSSSQQAAATWYIKEFQAICAAEPRCVQVPLPPVLSK